MSAPQPSYRGKPANYFCPSGRRCRLCVRGPPRRRRQFSLDPRVVLPDRRLASRFAQLRELLDREVQRLLPAEPGHAVVVAQVEVSPKDVVVPPILRQRRLPCEQRLAHRDVHPIAQPAAQVERRDQQQIALGAARLLVFALQRRQLGVDLGPPCAHLVGGEHALARRDAAGRPQKPRQLLAHGRRRRRGSWRTLSAGGLTMVPTRFASRCSASAFSASNR